MPSPSQWILGALALGNVFLVGFLLLRQFRDTGPSFLFGVRVPSDAQTDPDVQRLKSSFQRNLRRGTWISAGLTAVVFLLRPAWSIWILADSWFLPVLVFYALHCRCWRRARELKAARGWVVRDRRTMLVGRRSTNELSPFPIGWILTCVLILVASVWIAAARYPGLPTQIPTHFDAALRPDAWSPKSPLTVFLISGAHLAFLVVHTIVIWVIRRQKMQVDVDNLVLSYARHRMHRRRLGHGYGFLGLCLSLNMAILQLATVDALPERFRGAAPVVLWIVTFGCFVPVVWIHWRDGQGGSKLSPVLAPADYEAAGLRPAENEPLSVATRGDDRFWKFGLFYFNPDDPTLFVEDRFGTGTGVNYARPLAKVLTCLAVLSCLAMFSMPLWL